mgnify:CR=1 FL=1
MAEQAAVASAQQRSGPRSLVLVVMNGGPSQLELFDYKPKLAELQKVVNAGDEAAYQAAFAAAGVNIERFARIEGVADREPYVPEDRYDPRNRRISITLAWRE